MYGWNEKPETSQLSSTQVEGKTYSIGSYIVNVTDDGIVTHRRANERPTSLTHVLPNMEINDGQLTIPITDFVGEILKRLSPAELAVALWSDEDVRARFADEFVNGWNSDWSDDDRRKLLFGLKESVHNVALGKLTDDIASMEWHNSQRYYHRTHTTYVNDWLRNNGLSLSIPYEKEPEDFKVGGKSWNDARDYWRETVLRSFPSPLSPPSCSTATPWPFQPGQRVRFCKESISYTSEGEDQAHTVIGVYLNRHNEFRVHVSSDWPKYGGIDEIPPEDLEPA